MPMHDIDQEEEAEKRLLKRRKSLPGYLTRLRRGVKLCKNCNRLIPLDCRRCWYCKWEPWMVRNWWVPVVALALVALVMIYNMRQ